MQERAKQFTNIYIKNFGEDVDSKTLTEIFSKFGEDLFYGSIDETCYLVLLRLSHFSFYFRPNLERPGHDG